MVAATVADEEEEEDVEGKGGRWGTRTHNAQVDVMTVGWVGI